MSKIDIHAFSWGLKQAQILAQTLNVDCHEVLLHAFPDGESLVTAMPSAPIAVLYAELSYPNDKIFPLLLAADALRRNGATRLVLIAPYLCYMRQDVAFQPGQAISQQVIGRLFATTFDRVITVDAHLHRTHNLSDVFVGIDADNLLSGDPIADALKKTGYTPETVIAGPDEESTPLVTYIANQLGLSWTTATKTRRGDRSVNMLFPDPTLVKSRPVILVDDMVSSGVTIMMATQALLVAGAASVDIIVTHALFPNSVTSDLVHCGVRSVRSTTSLPHPTNDIPLDRLFASALRSECERNIP